MADYVEANRNSEAIAAWYAWAIFDDADLEASQATWKIQLEQPQIPSQHIILVR